MGLDEEKLSQLLDSWYLMRILSLAPSIISRDKPNTSFAFVCTMSICRQFVYARDIAPITELIAKEDAKEFSHIFDVASSLSLDIGRDDFSTKLRNLDQEKGVFVTAHWLTYIFDYQERADYVWAHLPMFYSMATKLSRKWESDMKKAFISTDRTIGLKDPWTGQRFTHRFYEKHKLGDQLCGTIETLNEYGGLVAYIDEKLKECQCLTKDNWIRLIAAALNVLIDRRGEVEKDLYHYAQENRFLHSEDIEPSKFPVVGGKRLWSALRDYIVDPYFRGLFIAGLSENNPVKSYLKNLDKCLVDQEVHLSQLELPGDSWNNEFTNSYLKGLGKLEGVINGNARISARRLYRWLLKHDKYSERVSNDRLFPIYLDATFVLRRSDLKLFMKRSSEIRSKIRSEIGDMLTEKDFLKAYDILRRQLQIQDWGLDL